MEDTHGIGKFDFFLLVFEGIMKGNVGCESMSHCYNK